MSDKVLLLKDKRYWHKLAAGTFGQKTVCGKSTDGAIETTHDVDRVACLRCDPVAFAEQERVMYEVEEWA